MLNFLIRCILRDVPTAYLETAYHAEWLRGIGKDQAIARKAVATKVYIESNDICTMYVPIGTPGHWSLLVLDLKSHRYIYLDPMVNGDANPPSQVSLVLAYYNSLVGGQAFVRDTSVKVGTPDYPHQGRTMDCALYTALYVAVHATQSQGVRMVSIYIFHDIHPMYM